MALTILHLSDIHIRSDNDIILKHGDKIGSACFRALPETTHLAILISGDIAYSGQQHQYDAAERLINEIRTKILTEKEIPITIITTPGNHDCNFNNNSQPRQLLLEFLRNNSSTIPDKATIDTCTAVQNEFFKFRDSLEKENNIQGDKLWRTTVIKTEEKQIAIESLNLAWCSKLQEEPGNLIFPINSYEHIGSDSCEPPRVSRRLLHLRMEPR
ncbi:metallophosphoesterase [Ottowia beijingensis]|uniref:metallophosphoesterase family protein n=1 Tax=Ottowia beijingensis TaxID=1207057 RepID=UPI002FDAFD77